MEQYQNLTIYLNYISRVWYLLWYKKKTLETSVNDYKHRLHFEHYNMGIKDVYSILY